MPQPIRILVVDDHFVVRSGLVASLELEPDLSVVGEADGATQAVEVYRDTKPDLVIMDFRLPATSGADVTAQLCREFENPKVLIFTTFEGDEDIYRAMQAGARGYLLKSAPREELLRAVRSVAAGQRFLPPEISHRLADRIAAPALSERELEVLRLVSTGRSNKEIGSTLNIAEDTVKRHVSNVLDKLKVNARAQAATEAIRRGLIRLE